MKIRKTITKLALPLMLGLLLTVVAVSAPSVASAQDSKLLLPGDGPIRSGNYLLTYARVLTNNVPLYRSPSDAAAGIAPTRSLGTGYVWVSLADPRPFAQDGQTWYKLNSDEYVRADYLAIYTPSTFHGVALPARPDKPFGWIVSSMLKASFTPGAAPASDAPLLPRYTLVTIYEEKQVGDWIWYRVGDNRWIEQRKAGVVKPSARPEGVGPTDKWIDVSLFEQTLAAYEGDRMVYATLLSSGLPGWNTDEGLFRIWLKAKITNMSGRSGFPDYYSLEDVPWTMYFDRDIAFHAAYWHDGFGFQHSHGCVNLPPQDARWLFDWATPTGETGWILPTDENPGTVVRVRQ